MKTLRRFLNFRKRRISEEGFTMLEMVSSVPVLALIGGVVVFTMGKALIIMADTTESMKAGEEIHQIMDDARSSSTCYSLANQTGSYLANEENNPFEVTSQIVDDCAAGSATTFTSKAVRVSDSRVLYESTTKIHIPE